MSHKKIHSSPNPGTYGCDRIWNKGLYRGDYGKVRSYWVRVGPVPVAGIFIRQTFGHRRTGSAK